MRAARRPQIQARHRPSHQTRKAATRGHVKAWDTYMKICLTQLALLCSTALLSGQTNNAFPLWAAGAPDALGKEDKDIPTLTPFLPEPSKATGAAMVICPGGGYGSLAPHEGQDYARFFNQYGIAGFVLKSRLGTGGYH